MKTYVAVVLTVLLLVGPVLSAGAEEPFDINTACSLQLEKLYRVGPAVASRIIAEREENGPFLSLVDLANRVRGIGPKTISHWEGMAVAIVP